MEKGKKYKKSEQCSDENIEIYKVLTLLLKQKKRNNRRGEKNLCTSTTNTTPLGPKNKKFSGLFFLFSPSILQTQ